MVQLTEIKKVYPWFIFAIIFDISHYHLWEFFRLEDRLFVYDSLEMLKATFYVYCGVEVFKNVNKFASILCNSFLFYVILDTISFIYDYKSEFLYENSLIDLTTFIFSLFLTFYLYRKDIFYGVSSRNHRDS